MDQIHKDINKCIHYTDYQVILNGNLLQRKEKEQWKEDNSQGNDGKADGGERGGLNKEQKKGYATETGSRINRTRETKMC